jgi:hypothetical protein
MKKKNTCTVMAMCLVLIGTLMISVYAYRVAVQRDMNASTLSALQLNSQFLDRISRLRLVELDLKKQIEHCSIIIPKKSDHRPFAGEEIDITIRWHDALVHSPQFAGLHDSLKTVVNDMTPLLSGLDQSFEKIRMLAAADQPGRERIMDSEIDREISALIALCENFVTQNAQAAAVGMNAARQNDDFLYVLGVILIIYCWGLVLLAGGLMFYGKSIYAIRKIRLQ